MGERRPKDLVLPRIGTLRDPDCETYGHQIGEVARRLGTPLMPWQQYAADVAYEIDPDTGRLKYNEVVLTIMRQSGKTTLVRAKKIARCTVFSHRLGPQVCMYTAQTRGAARKKLERDFIAALRAARDSGSFLEIENPKARPSKSTRQWKASLNNGQEHILFGRGNYLQIDAPNREAGHGDTVDDATIDEAFAHQTDAVEQAVRPAMATRTDAQKWDVSTAGDEKSFYFWPKVRNGRALVESGRASRTCYLEWSLPPDADIDDEDAWWEFMPALGRTISIDYIRSELERARQSTDGDGEDLFRRGYCNQWVRVPLVGAGESPQIITDEVWALRAVDDEASPIVGDIAVGVAVAPEGRSSAIVVAGRNGSGRVQVEVAYNEQGTFWLEHRLRGIVERNAPVAVAYHAASPASALAPEIVRAAGQVPVQAMAGRTYTSACDGFVLAAVEDRLNHIDQPWLTTALQGARKKYRGEAWMWDQLTALSDITTLVAATCAVYAVNSAEPPKRFEPAFAVT